MAFRIVLPPLTSEFMNIIKNSSVALTIGLLELTGRARAMQEFSFQVFEAFAAATVIYLLDQPDRGARHARARAARCACPGFIGRVGRAAGGALTDVRRLRLRRHPALAAAYLFREGMTFTLTLTLPRDDGRHHLRHAARDDAAVEAQAAVDGRRRAT